MRNSSILLIIAAAFVLGSCSYSRHPDSIFYDPNDPGHEYAPAMYHSFPYEPLTQVTNEDATSWYYNSMPFNDYDGKIKSNSITPVAGTIARGKFDYYTVYENSDAGRALAAAELHNTTEASDFNLMEGKRLYNLYCDHCHGENGNGNGSLMEAGKIPSPGAYYDKLVDRAEGSIYHTITHGKGIMGSHASQLSPDQRWLITRWVQVMQQGEEAHTITTIAEFDALTGSKEEAPTEADEDQLENDIESSTEINAIEEPSTDVAPEEAPDSETHN